MSSLLAIRVAVAAALLAAIALAAGARAPRRPTAGADLRRLVAGAVALDGLGIVAWLGGRALLSTAALAGGVAAATLAAWLSRGLRDDGPPDDGRPHTVPPPPPDGDAGPIDWERFDRERAAWARRPTAPR